MISEKQFSILIIFLLIPGIILSAWFINNRIISEKNYNSFLTAADYDDIINVSGDNIFELLVNFNLNQNISSLILKPEKFSKLVETGDINVLTGAEIVNSLKIQALLTPYILEVLSLKDINYSYTYIYSQNAEILNFITEFIKILKPDSKYELIEKKYGTRRNEKSYYILITDFDKNRLLNLDYGFNRKLIDNLKMTDLKLVFDFRNFSSENALKFLRNEKINPDYILIEKISQELNSYMLVNNITKIKYEFENNTIPYPFTRGHKVNIEDYSNYDNLFRRIKRAVWERKISFVEFVFDSKKDFESNYNAVVYVNQNMKNSGFTHKKSEYFKLIAVKNQKFKIGIIVFSLIVFIFSSMKAFFGFEIRETLIFIGVFSFIIIYYINRDYSSAVSVKLFCAFLASLIIPVHSLNLLKIKFSNNSLLQFKNTFSNIFELLSYNLTGVILVIPLFYDERFLQGDILFRGVKASLLIPVLIFIFYHLIKSRANIVKLMESQLKIKHLVVAVTVISGAFYYLLRSSNAGASFMLPLENDIRNLLEDLFVIRPRTKEFLFLYPAVFFFSMKFFPKRKSISYYLTLLLILIGQVSVYNTFMHFHTPLVLSIFRTFNGLILGLITGIILIMAVSGFYIFKNNILQTIEEKTAIEK